MAVVVPGADRVLEFFESLADGTAGVGQSLGSEDEERDDQDDYQVGRLKDAGEHDGLRGLRRTGHGEEEPRPVRVGRVVGAGYSGREPGWLPLVELALGGVGFPGELHDGLEETGGLAPEQVVVGE
jgi:hypothetical protein